MHTLNMLERVDGLPTESRFIGYQVHERIDGSGYPRGRSSLTVHPFSKIIALVDSFAAMTHPRPYRPAIHPHDAVHQILKSASHSKFDRQIAKAFLDVISAFPIGTQVELNNGFLGQVVRIHGNAHTRPVVARLDNEGRLSDEVIDLLKEQSLKVVNIIRPDLASVSSS